MNTGNPRFPHRCTIYRMRGESSFSKGEREVLYEGECRKYGNSSLRTFKLENVVKADYALSVPGVLEGVRAGYLIDVTDRSGSSLRCMVADVYAGNLGTTVYFNLSKN